MKPREGSYAYTSDECVKLNNALVDNAYFKIGNYVFKQVIGIGMGIDPAPFQANLGLYFYEFKFQNAYQNNGTARKLNRTQIFRDSINTKNDDGVFSANMKKIYPPELELCKENKDTTQCGSVLEINVSIKNRKVETSVFDKRDDFNFENVKYQSTESNIHDSTLHVVFLSQ